MSVERPKVSRGRAPSHRPGLTEGRKLPRRWRPSAVPGVAIRGPAGPRDADVLTVKALSFVADLHRRFAARARELISEAEVGAPVEAALPDRRIGIAPGDAPLVDFQAADAQAWRQLIERHLQVKDASAAGPVIVRPRQWRVIEEHLSVDGQPASAALFDFGLAAFHSTGPVRGARLHFDLGQAQKAPEAGLWDDVFQFAERALGLSAGVIRVAAAADPTP